MRYLAIDHGDKRTGLAVCDKSETLVTPHSVIETSKSAELIRRIVDVIESEQVEAIVLGLPFNMDDTEGPRAKAVRTFAAALSDQIDSPIYFHDERLSSFEAEEQTRTFELTRKKKKKRLDALAAAAILRSFLDTKEQSDSS